MLNLYRSPTILVGIFAFVIVTNRLYSQKLEWALSDGGQLSERALNVEKVPGGVIFLSSYGLEKRNEAGLLLWRFDFFELDDLSSSGRPTIGSITTDESGNIYANLNYPNKSPGPTTIENIDIPHGNSLIKINANGKLLWCKKIDGSKKTILQYSKGHIYVVGVFDDVINIAVTYSFENRENTDCPTGSSENIYARDIFVAKFNTIGQVH